MGEKNIRTMAQCELLKEKGSKSDFQNNELGMITGNFMAKKI